MNQAPERDLLVIESLLRRAADDFQYPPTPDVAAGVRARLNERPSLTGRLGPWWPRQAYGVAAAALAAAVVALTAAVAVPGSRSAIADFFHLSHVRIERDQGGSRTPPALSPESFARPTTVGEVRGIVDFPIKLPAAGGRVSRPDATYIQGEQYDAPIAIFVYEQAGYDIYESHDAYINKIIHSATPSRLVSFDGHYAYWVEGGGHVVESLDAEGRVVIETRRTVERATLIWEENGITYRIESSLPQAQTIAVAESLH
jgi:hypothetical protein